MVSFIPRRVGLFIIVAVNCAAILSASGSTAHAQKLPIVRHSGTIQSFIATVSAQLSIIVAEHQVCRGVRVNAEIKWLDAERKETAKIMVMGMPKLRDEVDALDDALLAESMKLKALLDCNWKKTHRPKTPNGKGHKPMSSSPPG